MTQFSVFRWKLYTDGNSVATLGNLLPCLCTLTVRSIFLSSDWFSWFPILVHCLLSSQKALLRKSVSFLFISSNQVSLHIDEISLKVVSKLNSSSYLSLFSQDNPLIIFVALCWTCSIKSATFLSSEIQNWKQNSSSTVNITFALQNMTITLKLN